MRSEYSSDTSVWPANGCGAKFVPWARGLSMVVELQMADDSVEAFASDRLPTILDDEIKRKKAEFYEAARKLEADELLDIIPVTFPMTHLLKGCPVVARYPVDEWEAQGCPYFSQRSWCSLCMKVAQKDETNLAGIMENAKKLLVSL